MYKAISFTLLVVSLSSCQSQIGVGKCQFYIQPADPQCQTFLFRNCTYYEPCGQDCFSKVTSLAWGYCFFHCCDQSYGQLSYQTLSNCNNYWTLAEKYLIAAATLGSVVVFMLCTFIPHFTCATNFGRCYFNFKQTWGRIFCCPQEIMQVQNDAYQQSATNLNKRTIGWGIPQSLEAKSWKKEICTICLSQDPNVQLKCAHYFHALCILSWQQKAKTCPLCLLAFSSEDKVIKICQKCFRKEREITLAQFGVNQLCDQCQQKGKRDLAAEEDMNQ